MNIPYTGVVGTLVQAEKLGKIKEVKPFLELLKSSGMWVSSEIYSEVLSITNENYEKIIYCDSLHRERKN